MGLGEGARVRTHVCSCFVLFHTQTSVEQVRHSHNKNINVSLAEISNCFSITLVLQLSDPVQHLRQFLVLGKSQA